MNLTSLEEIGSRQRWSVQQVHRRVTALSLCFDKDEIVIGANGKKLLTDSGLTKVWRLAELERGGLTIDAGVRQMMKELNIVEKSEENSQGQGSLSWSQANAMSKEIQQELRNQIARLEEDKKFLQDQVNMLLTQLAQSHDERRALSAGEVQRRESGVAGSSPSRWTLLKRIFGKKS